MSKEEGEECSIKRAMEFSKFTEEDCNNKALCKRAMRNRDKLELQVIAGVPLFHIDECISPPDLSGLTSRSAGVSTTAAGISSTDNTSGSRDDDNIKDGLLETTAGDGSVHTNGLPKEKKKCKPPRSAQYHLHVQKAQRKQAERYGLSSGSKEKQMRTCPWQCDEHNSYGCSNQQALQR